MTTQKHIRIREPFNGLSHFAGALLSLVGLFVLLAAARGQPRPLIGSGLYGASLVTLYVASALYHSLHVSRRAYDALGRFDYVAIFLLIAGTYAPLCLVTLHGAGGERLLAAEYGLALAGSVGVMAWRGMPDWTRWVLYIVMGWLFLPVFPHLRAALPPAALGWLLAGGARLHGGRRRAGLRPAAAVAGPQVGARGVASVRARRKRLPFLPDLPLHRSASLRHGRHRRRARRTQASFLNTPAAVPVV